MDSIINEVKEKLDIVDVISSYIKLEKAGANYRALCPFHSDKKPSFYVSPARQIWHCFGCGAGGDIFKFVMMIEGVEFGDALRILAQKAGVELKKQDPKLKTERQRLYEICSLATSFFEKQLAGSAVGKQAKEYLIKRGLKEETIKKWRLGYAPDKWSALSDFLVGQGYQRTEIVKAGLAVKSEKKESYYDRFRGRIIFPIFDLNSQVIGFGGRIFEKPGAGGEKTETTAKYINTPNTLLYDKSRVLYGLNFAKNKIRENNFCLLTEGYMDVIGSQQAGFENTVAASGTGLTSEQLKIIKRYTSNLLTAFDMDVAGNFATKRGADLAQSQGFEIKVVEMPEGADPADVSLGDPKKWAELVSRAKELNAFYFDTTIAKFDKNSPEGKKAISEILLPRIKQIPNKIVQYHWIKKLARVLDVSEEVVVEQMKKTKIEDALVSPSADLRGDDRLSRSENKPKSRKDMLEERVVSIVLGAPEELGSIEKEQLSLFSEPVKEILNSFIKAKLDDPKRSDDLQKVITKLESKSEEIRNILEVAALSGDLWQESKPKEELLLCLDQLEEMKVKEEMAKISKEIKETEEKGSDSKLEKLILQFNHLAKKLKKEKKNSIKN